jgi:membrane fusion protein, multidrug efflux system
VITCLCLLFVAIVVKLKLGPKGIAWMGVGFVVPVCAVIALWHLDAPMSGRVVTTQYVVQLVPYVKGQVKKVCAKANQPIKKGELLLEIDPAPYQYAVNQLEAQLATAKNNTSEAEAALEVSRAGIAVAQANVLTAKTTYDDRLKIQQENVEAVAKLKVVEAEASYAAARAGLQQAQATVAQSTSALTAAKSNVISVQSQLADAKFNLAQCTMYAPADGYIVDWQVQEGSWVAPVRLLAIGTFITTQEMFVVAVFPQNFLMNVQAGDEVELILDPYPGRLFKAKVDTVITATGEGQFAPSRTIPEASQVGSRGLLAVKIDLKDRPADVPLGAGGTVAIYTDHGKPVHIISKVALRMKKWLLYVLRA